MVGRRRTTSMPRSSAAAASGELASHEVEDGGHVPPRAGRDVVDVLAGRRRSSGGPVHRRTVASSGVGHGFDGMAHRQRRQAEPRRHLRAPAGGVDGVERLAPLVVGGGELQVDHGHGGERADVRRVRAGGAQAIEPEGVVQVDGAQLLERPHPPHRKPGCVRHVVGLLERGALPRRGRCPSPARPSTSRASHCTAASPTTAASARASDAVPSPARGPPGPSRPGLLGRRPGPAGCRPARAPPPPWRGGRRDRAGRRPARPRPPAGGGRLSPPGSTSRRMSAPPTDTAVAVSPRSTLISRRSRSARSSAGASARARACSANAAADVSAPESMDRRAARSSSSTARGVLPARVASLDAEEAPLHVVGSVVDHLQGATGEQVELGGRRRRPHGVAGQRVVEAEPGVLASSRCTRTAWPSSSAARPSGTSAAAAAIRQSKCRPRRAAATSR